MVQPNKNGIKSHPFKLDNQLVHNLKPSSPSSSLQTHEKLKKIMKKARSIKNDSPFKNKKNPQDSAPASPQKESPNYMKSTSSFEARKEQSPKTPTSTPPSKPNGSRTSSLKMMRTLTKTPSFKPLRSSKKVIMCKEHVAAARKATCSSTLKESKFPNYMQLNPGGTELDGTSAMKVCHYSYCSLNGHDHAHVPPLKTIMSARRRSLKIQKGFKLGCLSPRQVKPGVKKIDVIEPVVSAPENNRDFIIDIYCKDRRDDDLECSDFDWEEGCCSDSGLKLQGINGGVSEDQIGIKKTSVETLSDEYQEVYDEESVSFGAWSEEDGDSDSASASDCSCDQMKIDQDYVNYDAFGVSSTAASDVSDEIEEFQGLNYTTGDQKIDYQQEEPKNVPDFTEKAKDESEKNHTTIIYNIIQFNISVFVNGEKIEHTVQVPASCDKMETEEAMGGSKVNEMVSGDEELPFNVKDIASIEQVNSVEKQDDTEQKCNEDEAFNQSNSMELDAVSNMVEEPASGSDVVQTHSTVCTYETNSEIDIKMNSFCEKVASNDELPDHSINLRGSRKPHEESGDGSPEFNPRGPNFLPKTPDPDAETVDLKHQTMDDRKNAEEWMVDFALQQAVTTLAPERKRKVALLVEAFEKVMPVPMYETHNRYSSKAFTNSRPMQACS